MSSIAGSPDGVLSSSGRRIIGRLCSVLRMGGYVAFDLPRAVAAAGAALLLGIVGTHLYVLLRQPAPPVYFVVYSVLVSAACLLAAGTMWLALRPVVPRLGWFFGSCVCALFLAIYLISRVVQLPGLAAVTARWDFAAGNLALTCAAGFLALHLSVLVGVNVAYPQRRHWRD